MKTSVDLSSNCPFCGGTRLRSFSAFAYDAPPGTEKRIPIIECQDCAAAWQWPRVRTANSSLLEFTRGYAEHDPDSYFDTDKRASVAACQADFIGSHTKMSSGRLLDIGCGDGTFAREMFERGWDVTGIDPALPTMTREERQGRSLLLLPELPKDASCNNLFDVVTLIDVIEHVEQPLELLESSLSILKPAGLVIVETGNYQSSGRINGDDGWWNYQLDHRWYFAPPQLRDLAMSLHLQEITFADCVLRPWWKSPEGNDYPNRLQLLKSMLRRPRHALKICHRNRMLRSAHFAWPEWCHMEIATMISRKSA